MIFLLKKLSSIAYVLLAVLAVLFALTFLLAIWIFEKISGKPNDSKPKPIEPAPEAASMALQAIPRRKVLLVGTRSSRWIKS